MLDPKLIRESPEIVRAAIAKKHLAVDLDAVLAIDAAWRAQLQETEALRAQQKAANTAMASLPKGSPEFQAKLAAYGIAPPSHERVVHCPQCGSAETEEISRFGSTPCKAQWRCRACLEPFDRFKCH